MPPPPFVYQDPLPLGADDTAYRLLSREGVSTTTFEGHEMLKVEPSALAFLAQQAMHDCSFYLRPRHLQQVAAILDDPDASANDRYVALTLLKNAEIAEIQAGFFSRHDKIRTVEIRFRRCGDEQRDNALDRLLRTRTRGRLRRNRFAIFAALRRDRRTQALQFIAHAGIEFRRFGIGTAGNIIVRLFAEGGLDAVAGFARRDHAPSLPGFFRASEPVNRREHDRAEDGERNSDSCVPAHARLRVARRHPPV